MYHATLQTEVDTLDLDNLVIVQQEISVLMKTLEDKDPVGHIKCETALRAVNTIIQHFQKQTYTFVRAPMGRDKSHVEQKVRE